MTVGLTSFSAAFADVAFAGCGVRRMWRSQDVAFAGCGVHRMWRSQDVAFAGVAFAGCGVHRMWRSRMWRSQDVAFTGCGVRRMWRSQDVAFTGCGVHRMWRSQDVAFTGESTLAAVLASCRSTAPMMYRAPASAPCPMLVQRFLHRLFDRPPVVVGVTQQIADGSVRFPCLILVQRAPDPIPQEISIGTQGATFHNPDSKPSLAC